MTALSSTTPSARPSTRCGARRNRPTSTDMPTAMKNRPSSSPLNGSMSSSSSCRYSLSASITPARNAPSAIDSPTHAISAAVPRTSSSVNPTNTSRRRGAGPQPGARRDGRHDLHAAEAEDRAPQRPDALRVELQADEKQQEHDAELGELQHGLRVRDEAQAPGPDRHAGDQVAEHRPQAEPLAQGHGNDACGQVDQGLLKKAVRFHG